MDNTGPVPQLTCPQRRQVSLERVLQVPVPRLHDLMPIVIWPQPEKTPRETPTLLPDLET